MRMFTMIASARPAFFISVRDDPDVECFINLLFPEQDKLIPFRMIKN
jgi:hypothetical protein